MNGELLQAVECYEKALDHLLRNRLFIGSIFLPATEHEEGSEEMADADALDSESFPTPGAETERKKREERVRGAGRLAL